MSNQEVTEQETDEQADGAEKADGAEEEDHQTC